MPILLFVLAFFPATDCQLFDSNSDLFPISLTVFSNSTLRSSQYVMVKSLAEAVSKAQNYPSAVISLRPSLESVVLSTQISIGNELKIDGNRVILKVEKSLTIDELGSVWFANVTLVIESCSEVFLLSIGAVRISDVRVIQLPVPLVEFRGGTVDIVRSTFEGVKSSVLMIGAYEGNVTVSYCEFLGIGGDLVEVFTETKDGLLGISIADCQINDLLGAVFNYKLNPNSLISLSIRNSVITGSQGRIFTGKPSNSQLTAYNTSFSSLRQITTGTFTASTLTFSNCTITTVFSYPFYFDSLSGSLILVNSTITDIHQGPLFLVPANPYSPSESFIIVSNCNISNITNLIYKPASGLISAMSITVLFSNTEIWGLTALKDGFMQMTACVIHLSNIIYRDSIVNLTSFMEVTTSTLVVRNMTVLRVTNVSGVITLLSATSGYWVNMSFIDFIDPRPIAMKSLVPLWVGYGGDFSVNYSRIRNSAFVGVEIAATNYGSLKVFDTVFENLNCMRVLDAFVGGKVSLNNVTFVNITAGSVANCAQQEMCASLANVKFQGVVRVGTIFSLSPGNAEIYDTVLNGVSIGLLQVINSIVSVRNATFQNSNFVFCKECISSQISIRDFHLENITSESMFQLTISEVFLADFSITQSKAMQLFSMDSTNVTAERFNVSMCDLQSLGGLFVAESVSKITLKSSYFEGIVGQLSYKEGLIYLESSFLTMSQCIIDDFNSTLINSVASSIDISDSKFSNRRMQSDLKRRSKVYGGVLKDDSSTHILIVNSVFANITSDCGGVFYFYRSHKDGTEYELTNIRTENCSAAIYGGAIYGKLVSISISNSQFVSNRAQAGGAIWISGSSSDFGLHIRSTLFSDNFAEFNGGAIQHIDASIQTANISMSNNSAIYGPNFASQIRRISFLNRDSVSKSDFVLVAASGQRINQTIVLGLFDDYSQLVATDSSSQLVLYSLNSSDVVEGSVLLYPSGGVYNTSSIIIVAEPFASVKIYGETRTFNDFVFSVQMRDCRPGESFENSKCRLCTNNMYSLDPSIPCKLCPVEADCSEGFKLSLKSGYWRSSVTTDTIYSCVISKLCLGGFDSECLEGHTGVLCNQCEGNFFKANQLQCLPCSKVEIWATKTMLIFFASLCGIALPVIINGDLQMTSVVVFDYFRTLRILSNLNIYFPQSLSYLFVILGDIGSGGVTLLSNQCFNQILVTDSVYSELIISVIYTSAFILFTNLLLCPLVGFGLLHLSSQQVINIAFAGVYMMFPLLFTHAMQLFPCYEIEGVQRLIIDPSVECWTHEHSRFALGIAMPLIVISLMFALATLLPTLPICKRLFPALTQSAAFHLSIVLLKSYTLSAVLVFSSTLVLASQTSLVIVILISTEFLFNFKLSDRDAFSTSLFKVILATEVLFAFTCSLFDSSTYGAIDHFEIVFALICYVEFAIPAAYCVIIYAIARLQLNKAERQAKVHPINPSEPIPADSSGLLVPPPSSASDSSMILQV